MGIKKISIYDLRLCSIEKRMEHKIENYPYEISAICLQNSRCMKREEDHFKFVVEFWSLRERDDKHEEINLCMVYGLFLEVYLAQFTNGLQHQVYYTDGLQVKVTQVSVKIKTQYPT